MFLLRRGSLEERLDPSAYHPQRLRTLEALRTQSNGVVRLSDSVKFTRTQITNNDNELPYVGLENVESNTGRYLVTSEKDSISSAFIFQPGQILFPKLRPYLNKVLLADFTGICSTEFHVLQPTRFTASFLASYLRTSLTLNQTKWLTSGNTLPRLQTADVEGLLIPDCDSDAQIRIAQISEIAQQKYNDAIAQSKVHLASLDVYLASALGLTLPSTGLVPLSERRFHTRSRRVVGHRLDPLYYLFSLDNLLEGCKYSVRSLGEGCTYLSTGFAAGHQGQADDDDPTGIIQIRPTNISNDRQLIFTRNVYISEAEFIARPDQALRPGEVLFNNTNSQELVGKTVVFNLPGAYCSSNHITRLGLRPDIFDPYYLAAVLNLYQRNRVFYSLCTNWNNQSGIGADVLRPLKLPVPPLSEQQEIATHLRAIQEDAQQLQQDAQNTLANAQQQIEELILGVTI